MVDTIDQQPFRSLVQSIPSAQQQLQPMDTSVDQPGIPGPTLFGTGYSPSPEMWNRQAQQVAQQSMAQVEKVTGGFMPTFLATAAALKGDFGPAIALQRQKEQTAVGKAVIPVLAKINELKINGRFDEAYALANQAAVSAGDRAPEVSKIFQATTADIQQKQQKFANTVHQADLLMDMIKMEAQRTGTKPQDDLRYIPAQAMKKAAKNGTYFDDAYLNQLAVSQRIHTQVGPGNAVTQSTEASPAVSQTPMQQYTGASSLQNYVGYELAAKYKMTAEEMANVINGKPGTTAYGEVIQPGSDKAQQIKDDMTTLQPILGQQEVGKQIQLPPEINMQLLAGGQEPLSVLTKVFGPAASEMAQRLQEQRAIRLAEAPIIAGMQKNPVMLKNAGFETLDMDPASPDYLTPSKVPMTYNEVVASNGKFLPVSTDIVNKEVRPALRAIQGLRYVNTLFDSMGPSGTAYDRGVNAINRYVSDRLGIDTTGEMGITKASQSIVDSSIEELNRTETISREEIGQLKRLVTGGFTSEEAAKRTVRLIQQRIDEYLTRAIGQRAATANQLPPEVRNEQVGVPPNAQPVSQPGVYSTVPGVQQTQPQSVYPQGVLPPVPQVQQPSLPPGWRRK